MNDFDRMIEAARREERKRLAKTAILMCVILAIVLGAYSLGRRSSSTANETTSKEPSLEAPKPISRPTSGTILSGYRCYGSEITVTADSTHDYVVIVKDEHGTTYVSFYVRAGTTVTMGVPCDHLFVLFASGTNWYGFGKGLMFGDDTVYSKDDELVDFTYGQSWTYTLQPVTGGNFSESPSNEDEFFSYESFS